MPLTDIQVDFPSSYDSAASIMGKAANRQVFTLNGGVTVSGTTLVVDGTAGGNLYDLDDIELPCLLLFEGGEIWYIEDGDVASATTLSVNFSQRAQLGTDYQIHTDGSEVYTYFSGKQHEALVDILRALEKYNIVQGLQPSTPTLVGEAYVDTNHDIYVSFNGSSFTKLTSTDHTNLDDLPSTDDAAGKVHGEQYLNSDTGLSTWHSAFDGVHITGGDDHTHLVDASAVQRIAHGAALPTAEKVGQIFLKDDQLYFVYDSGLEFEEFFGIPSGSILPFPPASGCPSGWSEYTALNSNAYLLATTGGTGTTSGSNTHTHTISEIEAHTHTILEDTATSTTGGGHTHSVAYQGGGTFKTCLFKATTMQTTTGGSGTHSHSTGTQEAETTDGLTSGSMSASFVSDSGSGEPPYATMKWCKKD